MKRKFVCLLLVVALAVAMLASLTACGEVKYRYTIVYIGDSIAEALIGPSPLSERENYGYFALVGRTNGFNYYNHSISGHKTSTGIVSGEGLREVLLRETESATLMKTHLQQADMIHISVLGNNMLQYNLGTLMLEVADPDFETKYAQGTTLINVLEDGVPEGEDPPVKDGSTFDFPPTYQDICDIVDRLKELNPTATIVFQKVYNPLFEGTKHLSQSVKNRLANITDDGRFGKQGEPIASVEQYRRVADFLLGCLNGILDKYLAEHNGDEFLILDARAEFERVACLDQNEDGTPNYAETSLGRKLIFEDWTHPSNFGHAVIAGLTQNLLDELKVSSPNALREYKNIRLDQIDRMFASISGFDARKAKESVENAETYLDVTLAYFAAIDGYTPVGY